MCVLKAILVVLAMFGGAGAVLAETFEVVILNGRVMDLETNFDAIRNVGLKWEKIVKIAKDAIKGAETIDASGHVVSPGFVDGHVHVVDVPLGQKAATDLASTIIDCDQPGVASSNLGTFKFSRTNRKLDPLDSDAVYPEAAR